MGDISHKFVACQIGRYRDLQRFTNSACMAHVEMCSNSLTSCMAYVEMCSDSLTLHACMAYVKMCSNSLTLTICIMYVLAVVKGLTSLKYLAGDTDNIIIFLLPFHIKIVKQSVGTFDNFHHRVLALRVLLAIPPHDISIESPVYKGSAELIIYT